MSNGTPYHTPEAELVSNEAVGFELTGPNSVSAGQGWNWIAEGFNYFKKNPGAWIGTFIIWFVIIMVLAFIPLLGQIASMLLMYVFIGGFMLGCKAQAEGRDFEVAHLFAGFSGHAGKLILLSLLYAIISMAIMFLTLGSAYFAMISGGSPDAMVQDPMQFAVSILIALAILIPVAMAFWFAPVLIVVNDISISSALKLSFVGCLKNIIPFLVYGIMALLLYIVAIIPLFLGLFILIPTMIASIFTAYRSIYNS